MDERWVVLAFRVDGGADADEAADEAAEAVFAVCAQHVDGEVHTTVMYEPPRWLDEEG